MGIGGKKKEKKKGGREQENVQHKCNIITNNKEFYIYYPNQLALCKKKKLVYYPNPLEFAV